MALARLLSALDAFGWSMDDDAPFAVNALISVADLEGHQLAIHRVEVDGVVHGPDDQRVLEQAVGRRNDFGKLVEDDGDAADLPKLQQPQALIGGERLQWRGVEHCPPFQQRANIARRLG